MAAAALLRRWVAGLVMGVLVMTLSASTTARGAVPAERVGEHVVTAGLGSFVFDGYPPLADRPVRVHYSAPADPSHAQIVIVMHGLSHDGRSHRDDWARLVGDRNVIVPVPEFAEETYPDTGAYNIGNVIDGGIPQPPDQWTFHLVEALFDRVVTDLGSTSQDYALFGFSGSAQFVHRFVELMPRHRESGSTCARVGLCVCASRALCVCASRAIRRT